MAASRVSFIVNTVTLDAQMTAKWRGEWIYYLLAAKTCTFTS